MYFAKKAPLLWFSGVLFAAGLATQAGCRNQQASAAATRGDVLAQIDDTVVTVSDFQERINSQTPYVRARYTSLEHKKEFLENVVKFEILASEARRRGYDRDPDVIRTMKQVMIQRLLKQEFEKVKIEDISDADIKRYFDSHLDEFNKPAEVRASLIVVPTEDKAKLVLADARVKGLENAGFRDLVAQYSTDEPTKQRGGDLRYFDQGSKEFPPEIVEAAFKLKELGDVSGPIKTKSGVAVLKLTGRRAALTRTLDEVRQQIRNKLFRERRERLMAEYEKGLRQKADVKVFEERLSQVRVEPGSATPPNLAPPPGTGAFHPPGQSAPQAAPTTPPPLPKGDK